MPDVSNFVHYMGKIYGFEAGVGPISIDPDNSYTKSTSLATTLSTTPLGTAVGFMVESVNGDLYITGYDAIEDETVIARIKSDLTLDTSFGGGDGYIALDLLFDTETPQSAIATADGGALFAFNDGDNDVGFFKILLNGDSDTSFGTDGKQSHTLGDGAGVGTMVMSADGGTVYVPVVRGDDSTQSRVDMFDTTTWVFSTAFTFMSPANTSTTMPRAVILANDNLAVFGSRSSDTYFDIRMPNLAFDPTFNSGSRLTTTDCPPGWPIESDNGDILSISRNGGSGVAQICSFGNDGSFNGTTDISGATTYYVTGVLKLSNNLLLISLRYFSGGWFNHAVLVNGNPSP